MRKGGRLVCRGEEYVLTDCIEMFRDGEAEETVS
jgi:hypothetical protein